MEFPLRFYVDHESLEFYVSNWFDVIDPSLEMLGLAFNECYMSHHDVRMGGWSTIRAAKKEAKDILLKYWTGKEYWSRGDSKDGES